jgi:hypothetical protein
MLNKLITKRNDLPEDVQYRLLNSLLAIAEAIVKEEVLYFVRSTIFDRPDEADKDRSTGTTPTSTTSALRSTTRSGRTPEA